MLKAHQRPAGIKSSCLCASCTGRSVRPASVPVRRAPMVVRVQATPSAPAPAAAPVPRVEEARKYFRTVYDFPQWAKHRSQFRLIDRLLQIPQSHIMQNILPSLTWVASLSTVLVVYMTLYNDNQLPEGFPSFNPNTACQAFISNTSVALSLLLVFRTNSSYGRWDEARKMWGGLLNRSRDIMRQGATIFPDDAVAEKEALARWTVAFARCLRIHFQPETTWDAELANILKPAELELLKKGGHKPVIAIQAISRIIQNAPTDPVSMMQMSQNLTFFQDVLGGCERLLRAPIPVSYTRHTARFLFLWLSLLPFALYPTCGVWTMPVTIGIAGVLCGIEEIGVQCEEPFGILPLDVLCGRIQTDVMNTLKEDEETRQVLRKELGLPLEQPPRASNGKLPAPLASKPPPANGTGEYAVLVTVGSKGSN